MKNYLFPLVLILASYFWTPEVQAQSIQVTGTVSDEYANPLIRATVAIKNKAQGTFTQDDGSFVLNALPSDTLVFSYVGYEAQEIAVAGKTQFTITLLEQSSSLDEIVVVGYGVQKKSDITGSISQVKAEDLQRIPSSSVEQALQGKVAGVHITPVSGEPGAGAVVRIRGVGTLNNASPLYVVDGMLLDDISFLNLQDVASLEVLKDASATAIYGSRGANGVIIITTQSGSKGETRFKFDSYYGMQEPAQKIPLTNASEYAALSNELAINENRSPVFADPSSLGAGTDWQDEIFQSAAIQSYQLSADKSTEAIDFHISASYFKQEGIIKQSEFDRISLRLNNRYKLTPSISFGHNMALVHQESVPDPGVLGNAYRADPSVPAIDSLGNFGNTSINASIGNPVAQLFYFNNNSSRNRVVGNLFLELDLFKYFHVKSSFGLDYNAQQGKSFTPVFFVSAIQQNDENRLNVFTDRSTSLLWENTLTFDRDWDQHHLTVLGGITTQNFSFENLGGGRQNFPGETEEFYYLGAGDIESQSNFNSAFEWAMLSYLFRTNYSFKNRYLFTGSFRADGSSRFGKENRYGYFPSFALGWRISEESFMKSQSVINRLKLRASWGQIGNDKIGAYAGRAVVSSNLNAVFGPDESLASGASLILLSNPGIKWESTVQTDWGLEISFLDDRLQMEVDKYDRKTNDILVDVPIPAYVGAENNPVVNAAQVANKGWDFNLSWQDRKAGLNYRIGVVASTVNNEVLALGEGKEEIFGGDLGVGGKLATRTVVGLPIGAFYGYKVAGIFQNEGELTQFPNRGVEVPGDLRYSDINGDGIITTEDRTYLGSPIADFFWGGNLSFTFKGLDLVGEINGQSGNKIVNAKKMARFGTPNFETSYLERWTGTGTSTTEPRVTNGGHNYEMSERFLEDGSFIRLRTVQVGYSFAPSLLNPLRISRLRIYLSGTNLKTWSDYNGYTPEITSGSVISVGIDRGVYPIAKTFTAGVQATF